MTKRKRNDDNDSEEGDGDGRRDDMLKELMGELIEKLGDDYNFKKRKLREQQEEILINEIKNNKSSVGIETGIRNILKDIMDPIIEIERSKDNISGREPVFNYRINIPFPNQISYPQLSELASLRDVVSCQATESNKDGNMSILCIVSKDPLLKIAYGRKDLLKNENSNQAPKNIESGKTKLINVVTNILNTNLALSDDDDISVSTRTQPNGQVISILTQGVKPPISIGQIKRIITHDSVIINCFLKAAGPDTREMVLALEMFDQI